jgi:hypothetical protein
MRDAEIEILRCDSLITPTEYQSLKYLQHQHGFCLEAEAAMYPSCIWGSLWGSAWGSYFSSVVLQNQVLCKSVLEHQPSNFASCCSVQEIRIDTIDVNQMTTVFLVENFQPCSSAAVAYQPSTTHINFSHHRIIVDDCSGLFDVLVSNPSFSSWVTSFLSFLFMIINLSLYTGTFSFLSFAFFIV